MALPLWKPGTRRVSAASSIHTHPFLSSIAGLLESHVTDGFTFFCDSRGVTRKREE